MTTNLLSQSQVEAMVLEMLHLRAATVAEMSKVMEAFRLDTTPETAVDNAVWTLARLGLVSASAAAGSHELTWRLREMRP